jgi:hypothetical protein
MNQYRDRYTLASLVGFVLLLIVGGLWHTVFFNGFYHTELAPILRPRSLVSFVLLGELGKACALGYIYPFLAVQENTTVWGASARLSVLAVVLNFCLWTCLAYGVMAVPVIRWFWMDTLFSVAQGLIASYGIGLVYDFKRLREPVAKPIQQTT